MFETQRVVFSGGSEGGEGLHCGQEHAGGYNYRKCRRWRSYPGLDALYCQFGDRMLSDGGARECFLLTTFMYHTNFNRCA